MIIQGISHATGETVILSSKNIERACESDTWQLHRGHVLVQNTVLQNCTNTFKNNVANGDNQFYPTSVNIPNSFTHGTLAMNQIPLTSAFDIVSVEDLDRTSIVYPLRFGIYFQVEEEV
jgi:hypothetical protein